MLCCGAGNPARSRLSSRLLDIQPAPHRLKPVLLIFFLAPARFFFVAVPSYHLPHKSSIAAMLHTLTSSEKVLFLFIISSLSDRA